MPLFNSAALVTYKYADFMLDMLRASLSLRARARGILVSGHGRRAKREDAEERRRIHMEISVLRDIWIQL